MTFGSIGLCRPLVDAVSSSAAHVLAGDALASILRERIEQVQKHGFTLEHDMGHAPGELALASMDYLSRAVDQLNGPGRFAPADAETFWPWGGLFRPRDPRTNLVVAAAIAWVAIDRIDNAPRDEGDSLAGGFMRMVGGFVIDNDEAADRDGLEGRTA